MSLTIFSSDKTPFAPKKLWLLSGDIVSQTLDSGKHWDSHVYEALEPYLDPEAAVIDVGANVGAHALRFAEKARKVICFEPNPTMQFCLRTNLRGFGVEILGGLYSRPCELAPAPREGESPSSWCWLPQEGVGYAGPYFTADRVSAIKVDAQGADLHCLLGLKEVIERDHPAICFEYEEKLSVQHGHTWAMYCRQLDDWGYVTFKVVGDHDDFLARWTGGEK